MTDMEKQYLVEIVDVLAEVASYVDEHFGKRVSLRVLALHEAMDESVSVHAIRGRWEAERKGNIARIVGEVAAGKSPETA